MILDVTDTELLLARAQALEMQKPFSFVLTPLPEDALAMALLEKVPFLSGFLRSIDGTGVAVSKLAYIKGNELAGEISSGFRVAGVIIALVDFIRIPLMFLAAWLLNRPLPVTLSHTGRWLYSTVVLGLALAGVLAPITVAPFIALAAGCLAFAVSVFVFVKHFYDRYQTKQALRQSIIDIDKAESKLRVLLREAQQLSILLHDPKEKTNYPYYVIQLKPLQEKLERRKEKLQSLYDKQFENLQFMNELGWSGVRDKTVGMAIAMAGVIGLALALFFPHIGLVLFAISAAASGVYIIGLVTYLLTPIVIEKFRAKFAMESTRTDELQPLIEKQELAQVANLEELNFFDSGVTEDRNLASTSLTMLTLFSEKEAIETLREQEQHRKSLEQIDKNLSTYIERQDVPKIIYFFSDMARYTQFHQATEGDIIIFLNYFTNTERALQVLNQTLRNNEVTKQDVDQLLSYPPLTRVLIDRGVTALPYQSAHFVQSSQALNWSAACMQDNDPESNLKHLTH
ncbi:coiled-coil protein [Legionella drozanskii LLAP-1]|uniref:Coiled-coil protein n=2 Tax=Legionellaceae TaxID=444 RepID=A0A0W0SXA1_9GAMM|nr:coiled-coil protein [Legionella drozanskii LLAP-1]PJE07314.1 MAG: hypothetical protein CK430_13940 [Legionella sp.]